MLKTRMTKTAAVTAKLTAVFVVAVMVCAMFAPAANAAASTMKPYTTEERYNGLTAAEIAAVESGLTIQIRNISKSEQDAFILRFGNGNGHRVDGAPTTGVGDDKYPIMEKLLADNGYPAISRDLCRNLNASELAAAYGSNTLEELFLGVDKNGNRVSTSAANALYTAKNNTSIFKYDAETGYYTYDSKYNHAYFDINKEEFVLYNAPLRPGAITASYGYQSFGAFLPFNNATDDVVKITDASGNLVNDVTFGGAVKDMTTIEFNKDLMDAGEANANPVPNLHAIYNGSTKNLADNWFIMSVEFNFFVPKDGQLNGEDMIFHFSGDDDVWVYLDGVLVVDQGGTHRHTESNINFATGVVNYQHYDYNGNVPEGVTLDEDAPVDGNWKWYETKIKTAFESAGVYDAADFDGDTFTDYSEHTFKFIFLERGGEASNCELYFNMPVMPDGALDVMKSVSGDLSDAAAQADYTFVLADEEGDPLADAAYSVMHTDGTLTAGQKTGADGAFKLKANEKAVFSEIDGDKQYSVVQLTELADANYATYNEGASCTVDGAAVGTMTDKGLCTGNIHVNYDQKKVIDFTNDLKELSFTVEKKTGDYILDTEKFEFDVSIITHEDDDDAKDIKTIETISLANGESKTYTVPVGSTVSVTENVPTGYVVSYDVDKSGSYTSGSSYDYDGEPLLVDQTVTFLNELETYNLTVTKEIQGSLGDKTKEFQFWASATINGQSVDMSANNGLTYNAEQGVYEFKLAHDGTMVISGIPYGAEVIVNEDPETYVAKCGLNTPSAEGTRCVVSSMTSDNTAAYLNTLDGAPPTGVTLDSLPYVLMFALVLAGAGAMLVSRRRQREFE